VLCLGLPVLCPYMSHMLPAIHADHPFLSTSLPNAAFGLDLFLRHWGKHHINIMIAKAMSTSELTQVTAADLTLHRHDSNTTGQREAE